MEIKNKAIKLLSRYTTNEYSNIVLNEFFKKENLKQKEKGFITEIFYGVIRNKKFINYCIKKYTKKVDKKWLHKLFSLSIYQGLFMNSDQKGVVWEATELTKKKYGQGLSKFTNGVLRNIFRDEDKIKKDLISNGREDILYSYPKNIFDKIKKQNPNNYINIMKSYKENGTLSIRVNKIKYNTTDFEKYLKENNINILKKVRSVYYLDSGKILASKIFKDGKIIAQDASSFLAATSLNAKPGERILDACAAPGGKTLVLAQEMNNKGEILAFDIFENKLNKMKGNIKKVGAKIIKTQKRDSTDLKDLGKFDKILLDAPCSGLGVIRKKPEIIYNKSLKDIKELVELQQRLLNSVKTVLKPEGELLYSTCTILDEENTENIRTFLSKNLNFKVENIELPKSINFEEDDLGGVKINYKEKYADGFYMIKLIKKNN
ncbi:MAG: 16S rRNA (cytosine(967)-C(5))-methyltransferase RsmB [Fusobacteriota bacterium]